MNRLCLFKNKMGIHDYVCFVQRNGQYIQALELLPNPKNFREEFLEDLKNNDLDPTDEENIPNRDNVLRFLNDLDIEGTGQNSAILVKIPFLEGMARETILSWHLSEFAKYAYSTVEYSWDSWDFIENGEYLDYNTVFSSASSTIDESLWQKDGHWIVNFDPLAYEAFVLQKHSCYSIPATYYMAVLENRQKKIEDYGILDKKIIFEEITKNGI
jgi:hypothetical protein